MGNVATFPASLTLSYLYDENSQLLGEYGDATRDYIWLDGIPVAVSDTVLRGGLSFSVQTTTNYVHADGLNTPRAITDASGKVQWQWNYTGNPFGEQPPTSGTGFVYNLRYAGQYYDAESGLMDNINRTYEPATGRYLQSDPIGLRGGWSTYAYVHGNPMQRVDPLGLDDTQCMYDPSSCGMSMGNGGVMNFSLGLGAWGNLLGGFGSGEVGGDVDTTGVMCVHVQTCGGLIAGLPVQGEIGVTGSVGTGGLCSGAQVTKGAFVIGGAGVAGGGQVTGNSSGLSISKGIVGIGGSPEGGVGGAGGLRCTTQYRCTK